MECYYFRLVLILHLFPINMQLMDITVQLVQLLSMCCLNCYYPLLHHFDLISQSHYLLFCCSYFIIFLLDQFFSLTHPILMFVSCFIELCFTVMQCCCGGMENVFQFSILLILLFKSNNKLVLYLSHLLHKCLQFSLVLLLLQGYGLGEMLYLQFFVGEVDHYSVILCFQYLAFLFELVDVLCSMVFLCFEFDVFLLQFMVLGILDQHFFVLHVHISASIMLKLLQLLLMLQYYVGDLLIFGCQLLLQLIDILSQLVELIAVFLYHLTLQSFLLLHLPLQLPIQCLRLYQSVISNGKTLQQSRFLLLLRLPLQTTIQLLELWVSHDDRQKITGFIMVELLLNSKQKFIISAFFGLAGCLGQIGAVWGEWGFVCVHIFQDQFYIITNSYHHKANISLRYSRQAINQLSNIFNSYRIKS